MAILERTRGIIRVMKRSLVISSVSYSFCLMIILPTISHAATPTPTPSVSSTFSPAPTSASTSSEIKADRATARLALQQSLEQAQNGSDLAFADAKATMMQATAAAGKDRALRKIALAAYKTSVAGIVTAYKAAIAQAHAAYKAALAAIKGK